MVILQEEIFLSWTKIIVTFLMIEIDHVKKNFTTLISPTVVLKNFFYLRILDFL